MASHALDHVSRSNALVDKKRIRKAIKNHRFIGNPIPYFRNLMCHVKLLFLHFNHNDAIDIFYTPF